MGYPHFIGGYMLNSQLKNSIAPYEEKGRWYHFFVESDGSALSLTTKDINASVSGSYLQMPADYQIIDYKVALHVDAASAVSFTPGIRLYSNGTQGAILPAASSIDYADVWVFANIIE